jgi:hypothetical protein
MVDLSVVDALCRRFNCLVGELFEFEDSSNVRDQVELKASEHPALPYGLKPWKMNK